MKRHLFKLLTLLMVLAMVIGTVPVSAATKKATVKTVKALKKELKKSGKEKITLTTKTKNTLTIPKVKGSKNKILVIKAPNAKIVNKSTYSSVTIEKCKSFTEKASGNSFIIKDKNTTFTTSKGSSVKKIKVETTKANITAQKNTVIADISCDMASAKVEVNVENKADVNVSLNEKTTLKISGDKKADVNVSSYAANSIVTASVPVDVETTEKIELNLNKGSEGTVVDSKNNAEVAVTNKTDKEIVYKEDGKETDVQPDAKPTPTSEVTEPTGTDPNKSTGTVSPTSGELTQSPTPSGTKIPTQEPTKAPTKTPVTTTPTQNPATNTPVPTKNPTTSTPVPTQNPTTNTPAPTQNPVTNTPAPTQNPVTNTPAPTQNPVTNTPAPTQNPVTNTPVPTQNPVTNIPVPTQNPVTNTPVPTQNPVTNTPAPTQNPVTDTPSPTQNPVTDTPSPTQNPVTDTPSPTQNPVTNTPTESDRAILVTYNQAEARQMLSLINNYRSTHGTGDAAVQLYYDYDLEKAAMQRALEIALLYDEGSHSRLDGKDYRQTFEDYGFDTSPRNHIYGENILFGTNNTIQTYTEAFDYWVANASNPDPMLGFYTDLYGEPGAVAIGHVKIGESDFWVQMFFDETHNKTATDAVSGQKYVNVNIPDNMVTVNATLPSTINLSVGQKVEVPVVVPKITVSGSYSDEMSLKPLTFTAKDGTISIDGGVITGVTAGNTSIIATVYGKTFTIDVEVK